MPGNASTPTVASTTAKPNTLTGLASGTTYYVYVRAVKGSDKSNWSTPAMVNTKAEPIDLPYYYGFEDKRLPCSWNVITTMPAYLMAIIDNENNANAHAGDNYLKIRRHEIAIPQEIAGTLIAVLPEVASTYSLNKYQITFWAKKTESNRTPTFTVGIMTDPNDASTFVQQETSITPTDTYQQYTVRFNQYAGDGHYIAIKQTLYGEACIDDIAVEELEGADIYFAKEGYATYYNSQRAMTLPEGMKARIVTAKGTADADGIIPLTYKTIAGGESGTNIVPSGTAVLLQVAPTEEPQTITVPLLDDPSGVTSITGSLLHGSDTKATTTGNSGDLFFMLTYNAQGKNIGWYWGEDNGDAFQSDAHKAWLALPASAARKFIGLPGFNEESSVTSIQRLADNGNDIWYTIDGRKLQGSPTRKGFYLRSSGRFQGKSNSSKVIVK